MQRKWITYTMPVEMQNPTSTLENSILMASFKIKYALNWWSSKCALGHLFQRNENLHSQNLYANIYVLVKAKKKWKKPKLTNCDIAIPWNTTQQ